MNWYKHSMPTVSDITPVIDNICNEIKSIVGVNNVFIWGSYLKNIDNPNYAVKDVDIIAYTIFDVGDLLAIDGGRKSALHLHQHNLEEEGFNPDAVKFTKKFISYEKYNIDHWAVSDKGKLLHWGVMPENQEDWSELHSEAEIRASKTVGVKRSELYRSLPEKRKEWRQVFDDYISGFLSKKSSGWCLSEHRFEEIKDKVKKI